MKLAFDIVSISFLIILGITIFTYLPKIIFHIVGLGRAKTFKKAETKHRYAIIIPARNESRVIKNLLDSIQNQTYPADKLDTFVIVETATDKTVKICENYPRTHVLFRQNLENQRKGYAVDEALNQIKASEKTYEAFFVFDADNILDENFIDEMNDSFDAGYDVAVGYRNSKNWNDGWVSACSGLTFTYFSKFKNKPRAKMGMSVQLSGTGFYVSNKLINELGGWNFHTLTEDHEFTLSVALNNYKSTYNERAIFYDEQPVNLKTSWKQRLRWCRGYSQAETLYKNKIIGKAFKEKGKRAFDLFETGLSILPSVLFYILIIVYGIANFVLTIVSLSQSLPIWHYFLIYTFAPFLVYYIFVAIYTAMLLILEHKHIKIRPIKALSACLMNPIFMMLYIPIFLQQACMKDVSWSSIPHSKTM